MKPGLPFLATEHATLAKVLVSFSHMVSPSFEHHIPIFIIAQKKYDFSALALLLSVSKISSNRCGIQVNMTCTK